MLVRSDLNVPLDDGRITDDGRIRASVPQIRSLLDAGAKVLVCAHLGRPKGTPDPRYSLAPVASRLGELLGRDVAFVEDPAANAAGDVWDSADVALLENVRFNAGETSKDEAERAAPASGRDSAQPPPTQPTTADVPDQAVWSLWTWGMAGMLFAGDEIGRAHV